MHRLYHVGAIVILYAVAFTGCTKKTTSSRSNGTGPATTVPDDGAPTEEPQKDQLSVDLPPMETPPEDDTTVTLTAPVAGAVTSSLNGVEVGTLQIGMGLFARLGLIAGSSTQCSAGSFDVKLIGSGDGAPYLDNVSFADAAFSIPNMPVSDEGMVTFTCGEGGTIRCLAKAGDAGILCNGIADTVLAAFEHALNKNLYDASFKGKKVSKLAASIVEASRVASEEVDEFKAALTTCSVESNPTNQRLCYKSAIEVSPFNGAFQVMKQMASSWSVDGLFSLVTDVYGLDIEIDNMLYTDLFTNIDAGMGITFMAETRTLLKDVVAAQRAKTGTYPYKVSCGVEINGQVKYFDPEVTGDQVGCDDADAVDVLATAGIALTGPQLTEFLQGDLRNEVDCPTYAYKNQQGKCWLNLRTVIKAIASEPDRNDINGTNRPPRHSRGVHLISVMPQVMVALVDAGFTANMGPPVINWNDPVEAKKARDVIAAKKDYFTGLIGIYRFLNDPAIASTKLSLKDLHEIFVGADFMNTRLAGWGPGINGKEVATTNGNMWIPPVLTYDPQLLGYKVEDTFRWDKNVILTASEVTALMTNSAIPYRDTFAMFQKIPNSRELDNFVFNSSHHEEWNPMGEKYLYVAQYKSTGHPIACKMMNPGPNFTLAANTSLSCAADYTGVSCTDGACNFPPEFDFPLVLFERGWFGDDKGRLFALGGRKTGRELGLGNSRGIMVKESKAGNGAGKCDASQKGTVIEYVEEFWCGPNTRCEEKIRAYCMDMTDLGTIAVRRFYPGGMYEVQQFNALTGQTSTYNVPMVGLHTIAATDFKNDVPACLFVPTTGGTFESTSDIGICDQNLNTTTGVITTLAGGAAIKDCNTAAAGTETKYRLIQWKDFDSSATDADMHVFLMNSQNRMLQFKRSGDPWESTYVKLTKASIDTLLSGKAVAPATAATQINSMKYLNPMHDSKFDPYCDDEDNNGFCDCYPLKKVLANGSLEHDLTTRKVKPAECGLQDKAAELTVSSLPYCPNCGASTTAAENFLKDFGGKAGTGLMDIAARLAPDQNVQMDVQRIAVCQFKFAGESQRRYPSRIDWGAWAGTNHDGCPASAGAVYAANAKGPLRIMNLKPMKNAYNIGRPKSMIKLMNYATKTVGQGTLLNGDDKVFSLDEALAMITLRQALTPENLKVFVSDGINSVREIKSIMTAYEPVERIGGGEGGPFAQVLKAMLYKAGRITQQDVTFQMGSE